MKVVFVCTGNTCRSVMAHYYVRGLWAKKGREDVVVDSCGVNPTVGKVPAANGVTVLTEEGFPAPVVEHAAQAASEEMLADATYIVCMTRAHLDTIHERFPAAKGRAFLLLSHLGAREGACVSDPVGQSLEVYRSCFELMRPALEAIAEA